MRKLYQLIIALIIGVLFALFIVGCGSEKSDDKITEPIKVKPKIEIKESVCELIEKDADGAVKAIKKYFSNPYNDTMPNLTDLKGFVPINTVVIDGDLSQIKIIVTNENKICEKGKRFMISIPKGENDYWQL